jgi:hypothetical protein
MTGKGHLNNGKPVIYFVENPQPGEEDKIRAVGDRRDVRGWILKELGISDEMINNPPLDPLKAQELIAKGLNIPLLQAAILDRATRNSRGETADFYLQETLKHPENFVAPELATLVEDINKLTPNDWKKIAQSAPHWQQTHEHRHLHLLHPRLNRPIEDIAYLDAVSDVVETAILHAHDGVPVDIVDREQMKVLPVGLGMIVGQRASPDTSRHFLEIAQMLLDEAKQGNYDFENLIPRPPPLEITQDDAGTINIKTTPTGKPVDGEINEQEKSEFDRMTKDLFPEK